MKLKYESLDSLRGDFLFASTGTKRHAIPLTWISKISLTRKSIVGQTSAFGAAIGAVLIGYGAYSGSTGWLSENFGVGIAGATIGGLIGGMSGALVGTSASADYVVDISQKSLSEKASAILRAIEKQKANGERNPLSNSIS